MITWESIKKKNLNNNVELFISKTIKKCLSLQTDNYLKKNTKINTVKTCRQAHASVDG